MERYSDLGALERGDRRRARRPPELVLVRARAIGDHAEAQAEACGGELAEAIHTITEATLELAAGMDRLSSLWPSQSFVLITEGALAVSEEESPNLTQAALAGLLRKRPVRAPRALLR